MSQRRGLKEDRGDSNRAVLVSVGTFDPGVKLGRRPGAERDTRRLHRVLRKMGFKVELHIDPSAKEIHQLFLKGKTTHSWSSKTLKSERVL